MKTLLEVAKWCGVYLGMQKQCLCNKGPSENSTTKVNLLPLALPKDVSVGAVAGCSALPMLHAALLCLHHCCYYMAGTYPGFPSLGMQS